MNKKSFLSRLDTALSGLTDEERRRHLDYYGEMIDDIMEDGLSEKEAVSRLGSVQGIASKILREAEPGQFKKKKKLGLLGKILIVLGVLAILAAILAAVFCFRNEIPVRELDDIDDIVVFDELFDDAFDPENWTHITDGSNLEITPDDAQAKGLTAIDAYWKYGSVTVGETEGRNIVVSLGGLQGDLLRYEIEDGVLYLSGPKEEEIDRSIELRILLPEDRSAVQKLNVATDTGDVSIDCDGLTEVRAVSASGRVNVADTGDRLERLSLCTASGDIRAELDSDVDTDVDVTSASGSVTLLVDEEQGFTMNYATVTGKVSVGFDRGFTPDIKVGQNGEAIYSQYEHRGFGHMMLNITTSSGDIRLMDD